MQNHSKEFLYAYERLEINTTFKSKPEDFKVEEVLPFELTGEGEHVWLYVQKTDSNTDWVAKQLAIVAGVKSVAIGYAGLKDRYAITCQWFSVQLPGKEAPDWGGLPEGIKIIESKRHQKKLNRGALKENIFTIVLRDLNNQSAELEKRCQLVAEQGVPNYFGEQRFGRNRNNLIEAEKLFSHNRQRISRHKRGLYLSAARSWLFNQILSERIQRNNWNTYVNGDVFMLDGKSACFADDKSDDLMQRLVDASIHPTAPLWGEGEMMVVDESADIEQSVIDQFPAFKRGLLDCRVSIQRRSLRVIPKAMSWKWQDGQFCLTFALQAGSYATSVLRELVTLKEENHAKIRLQQEENL